MIKYSKPVLTGNSDSSYLSNIVFDLQILDADKIQIKDDVILVKIKIDINSQSLLNLIENNKAKLGIRVKATYFIKYINYDIHQENVEIIIDTRDLKNIDTISFIAYITANEEIALDYSPEELKEEYKGYTFSFLKNEIMAESNREKFDYQANGNPFIQIIKCADQVGISFSAKEQNVINVRLNEETNIAFNKLQNETLQVSPKKIMNTFITYNAILYALLKVLVDGVDCYSETEWFKTLEYNFNLDGFDDLKSYLKSISGSTIGDLDIDSLIQTVQSLIHNKLSENIVSTWEDSNGNHIKKN